MQRCTKVFIGSCFVLTLSLLASTSAFSAASASALPDQISKALKRFKLDGTGLSVLVKEVDTNKVLLAVNADTPRNPASTIKLFTSFIALDMLTPAYQWSTAINADGELKEGVLDGDLWIKGDGDPFLPLERMWLLIHQLRNTGLTEINGDLYIDQSEFEDLEEDPSDFDGQGFRAYNVVPAALVSNFNVSLLLFRPTSSGKVNVEITPNLDGLKINNRLRTVDRPCNGYNRGIAINRGDNGEIILEGKFPKRCKIYGMSRSLMDRDQYTAELFRTLWRQSGGRWDGKLNTGSKTFEERSLLDFKSVFLGEAVRSINKYSNNLMTRMLFLNLGRERYGAPATTQKSRLTIDNWLQQHNINSDRLVIENGAGSSRRARVSANQMGDLLGTAWTSPYMPELLASMSVPGEDGTFARRHRKSSLSGRAHLKTGRLDHVVGMAGFVQAKNNKRYIVVAIHNAKEVHRGAGHAVQDALLNWVYARD